MLVRGDHLAAPGVGRGEHRQPAAGPAERRSGLLHPGKLPGCGLVVRAADRPELAGAEGLRRHAPDVLGVLGVPAIGHREGIARGLQQSHPDRIDIADGVGRDIARGARAGAVAHLEDIAGDGRQSEDVVTEAQALPSVAVDLPLRRRGAVARIDHPPGDGIEGVGGLQLVRVQQRGEIAPRLRPGLGLAHDDLRRRGAAGQAGQPGDGRARQRIAIDPVRLVVGGVGSAPGDGERKVRPGDRRRPDCEALAGPLSLGGRDQVATDGGAGQVALARQGVVRAPGDARHPGRRTARREQRVLAFLDRGQVHDLAQALARQVGLDQQRSSDGKAEADALQPHLGGAAGEAAIGVVPPIGGDRIVPVHRDGVGGRACEACPDLERRLGPVGACGADLHARRQGPARDLAEQKRRSADRRKRLVVNQPGQAGHRSALRRGLQGRLGGHPILHVAEFIGDAAQRFHEHHPEIRLGPFLPLRIAQGRELAQRLFEAQEVLGQIVDGGNVDVVRRAVRRGGLAVEIAGAEDLEGELDALVGAVEPGGVDQRQPIVGEVAVAERVQGEQRPGLVVSAPVGGHDVGDRHVRDPVAAADRRGHAGLFDVRSVDEVHPQDRRIDDVDLDKVDAIPGGRSLQGDEAVAGGLGHVRSPAPRSGRRRASRSARTRRGSRSRRPAGGPPPPPYRRPWSRSPPAH